MKNYVHLPTGENEEIGMFWAIFYTMATNAEQQTPQSTPMGSRSAVLNAVLLKLVAKEKGAVVLPESP